MRMYPSNMAAALFVLAGVACGGGAPAPPTGRATVVATTTIVADLVRSLAADRVEVVSLMGAGVDPHLYKASAGDMRRMASADAIVYSGLHLEGKMAELLEEMGQRGRRTLAVAECLPADRLISAPGFSGVHDPHAWFDVGLWSEAVPCVTELLVALDPAGEEVYQTQAVAYAAELDGLDGWVRQRLASIPEERRVLISAHDAFGYFGRAYGLEVRGLLGVSTASEAGAADVQQLATFIADRRIPAVFVETSVPTRYVQALREAVEARGLEIAIGGSLYSDALGNPGSDAATYVGTVRANVEIIATALSLGPSGGGE